MMHHIGNLKSMQSKYRRTLATVDVRRTHRSGAIHVIQQITGTRTRVAWLFPGPRSSPTLPSFRHDANLNVGKVTVLIQRTLYGER